MPRKPKTTFPMDFFLKRLEEIRQEFGLKKKDFENAIGMKNTSRWGKSVFSVEQDTLQIIAHTFDKSINWLLGSDNAMELLPEEDKTKYDSTGTATIKIGILGIILDNMMNVIEDKELKLSNVQQNNLLKKLLDYYVTKAEIPDKIIIKKFLLLE